VLGTDPATPLEFWVAIGPEQFLQLDDVVALERTLPDGTRVKIYGLVTQVRARHEGARFDSDVFLIADGVLPAEIAQAAQVLATRFEPEIFVPPLPGQEVYRAAAEARLEALFFDRMEKLLPAGLSRDGEPLWINLEFLDGNRGAHVNISGVSGVATKTTYASFLLYSLFHSGVLAGRERNTKALIFNVKGEDLLFLDRANKALDKRHQETYRKLGLEPGPFRSVELWAPPRRDSPAAVPDVASRHDDVSSFFWTLAEFCREGFLPFLFADAEDDRQQYTIVVHNTKARLAEALPLPEGGVRIEDEEVRTFRDLVDLIAARVASEEETTRRRWVGQAIGQGTSNAFVRRLAAAVDPVAHLVRGDVPDAAQHRIARQRQVTVVDIHNLNDRAKRFVVGVVLRKAFEDKERSGQAEPRLYVVLDELNKYAPREGGSPIKEILLDVAERGRSLGIVLIGAQQTASEVERRIIANSAIRVVGRLDSGEAQRDEYGWLPTTHRQRSTILKPGTMMLAQPEIPVPLVVEFPFPSWATRPAEARPAEARPAEAEERLQPGKQQDDPFAGLVSRKPPGVAATKKKA
jgi:DNA helicase HerA-like ATPase